MQNRFSWILQVWNIWKTVCAGHEEDWYYWLMHDNAYQEAHHIEHWRSLVIVAKPLQPTNSNPSCRPQISGRAESWVIVDLDFMASTHESSLKLWTILAPRLADPSTTRTAIGWFWGAWQRCGTGLCNVHQSERTRLHICDRKTDTKQEQEKHLIFV